MHPRTVSNIIGPRMETRIPSRKKRWWLDAGMPYTPVQMEEIFQRLALPGIRNVVEGERA